MTNIERANQRAKQLQREAQKCYVENYQERRNEYRLLAVTPDSEPLTVGCGENCEFCREQRIVEGKRQDNSILATGAGTKKAEKIGRSSI